MKKIYIVLSYTGTIPSKIIKVYTRREFSHVSISLDSELNYMYSFGRKNPYTPLIGGFVHENKEKGIYKRCKNTKIKIYSLEINDRKYKKIKKILKNMEKNKDNYKYNFLGVIAIALKLKIRRERCFYCAEFVKYVLEQSQVSTLPELVKPEHFEKLQGLDVVYNGILREYQANNN